MSAEPTVRRCGGEELGRLSRPLEQLYRRCFGGPPWNETAERMAAFPDRLASQLAHPGAGGLIAEDDGRLVAATYGWPAGTHLPSTSDFDRALAAAVTPATADRLAAPALVVAELMVDPAYRRTGAAA